MKNESVSLPRYKLMVGTKPLIYVAFTLYHISLKNASVSIKIAAKLAATTSSTTSQRRSGRPVADYYTNPNLILAARGAAATNRLPLTMRNGRVQTSSVTRIKCCRCSVKAQARDSFPAFGEAKISSRPPSRRIVDRRAQRPARPRRLKTVD